MPKVRDAIRIVESDGWQFQRMRGSHRQFKHPTRIREQNRADQERAARVQAEAELNAAMERIRQLEWPAAGEGQREGP